MLGDYLSKDLVSIVRDYLYGDVKYHKELYRKCINDIDVIIKKANAAIYDYKNYQTIREIYPYTPYYYSRSESFSIYI